MVMKNNYKKLFYPEIMLDYYFLYWLMDLGCAYYKKYTVVIVTPTFDNLIYLYVNTYLNTHMKLLFLRNILI